jgi:hypothetical protein
MQVLRVSRSALKFPARCLGCNAPAPRTHVGVPLGGLWARPGRVEVPVCRACWLRLRATRLLGVLAAVAVGVGLIALLHHEPIAIAGVALRWWILALVVVMHFLGGRLARRLPRVRRADGSEVELAFFDPALRAEVAAASQPPAMSAAAAGASSPPA